MQGFEAHGSATKASVETRISEKEQHGSFQPNETCCSFFCAGRPVAPLYAYAALRAAIVTRSFLAADPRDVWAAATTWEGINNEFRPLLRMTAPREVRERGLDGVVVGERLCRSWLLLFGVLPIDYDDITIERLDPGRGFLERSTMLTQRRWEHERTIEPAAGGCTLTDSIRYEPRLPIPDALLRPLFAGIFRYRHGRLRRRFGGEVVGRSS